MAMEIGSASTQKGGALARGCGKLLSLPEKSMAKVVDFARKMKQMGRDDPRRIYHSLKVGLAVMLVSLFYYFQPTYNSFGDSAIWAVMTVVVVFEFHVGATLGKGINRVLATMVAGALGLGAHHLAGLSGRAGEPIILGLFVFIQAAAASFLRFCPALKARYDYGLLIFTLTFSMVSVTGFRESEIWVVAQKRLSTILIGSCLCVIVSTVVFPVWAGQELHNQIASNLEKLAAFLEGFGTAYFKTKAENEGVKDGDDKLSLEGYKSVLNSKAGEESLANFAKWEPRHGGFMFRHPWQQYLKIGNLIRRCSYKLDSLNGYLTSDVQEPSEFLLRIQDTCISMSSESSKALKQLATAVKTMTWPSLADVHILNSKDSAKTLASLLELGLGQDKDLPAAIPAATVASLLNDVVSCTEELKESVLELASLAHFKRVEPTVSPEKSRRYESNAVMPVSEADETVIVVCPRSPEDLKPPAKASRPAAEV